MTIGEKIIEKRKNIKYSQEKLADILGITRQTLSNWESDITSPDLKQSKKLCEIFEISMDELVGNDINSILIKRTNYLEKRFHGLHDLLKLTIIVVGSFMLIVILLLLFLYFG